MNQKEIAATLGVGLGTVNRDIHAKDFPNGKSAVPEEPELTNDTGYDFPNGNSANQANQQIHPTDTARDGVLHTEARKDQATPNLFTEDQEREQRERAQRANLFAHVAKIVYLHEACGGGVSHVAKALREHGEEFEKQERYQSTRVHEACRPVAAWLLELVAALESNAHDDEGSTEVSGSADQEDSSGSSGDPYRSSRSVKSSTHSHRKSQRPTA